MRDPNRIPKVMDALEEMWKQFPDLRFCQFMCNLLGEISNGYNGTYRDPFYVEDPDFIQKAYKICEKWGAKF